MAETHNNVLNTHHSVRFKDSGNMGDGKGESDEGDSYSLDNILAAFKKSDVTKCSSTTSSYDDFDTGGEIEHERNVYETPMFNEDPNSIFAITLSPEEYTYDATNEKPFGCMMCEYRCRQKQHLEVHMRNHSGERPFKCSLCEYRCSIKGSLKIHMLKHTGEKPFSCGVCGYRCNQKGSLKVHMRTHTGEKPFACPYCDYRCAVKGNLKTHMMTHGRDQIFSCTECPFKCAQGSALQRHMFSHRQPMTRFDCPKCEYSCSLNEDLREHMLSHRTLEFLMEPKIQNSNHDLPFRNVQNHIGNISNPFQFLANIKENLIVPKKYACAVCPSKFDEAVDLHAHLLVHIKELTLSCSKCDFCCTDEKEMAQHMIIHSFGENKLNFNTSHTENQAQKVNISRQIDKENNEEEKSHLEDSCKQTIKEVKSEEIRSEEKKSQDITSSKSKVPEELYEQKTPDGNTNEQISKRDNSIDQTTQEEKTKESICMEQEESNVQDLLAEQSIGEKSEIENPVETQQIDAQSEINLLNDGAHEHFLYEDMSNEQDLQEETLLSCPHCNYKSPRGGKMNEHIMTHTGEKPFRCSMCGNLFSRRDKLKQHMVTHVGEETFFCSACPFRCNREHKLKQHMLVHSSDTYFSCPMCEYKSTRRDKLTQHLRTHTGEKPFPCDLCDSKFARKDKLKQHMTTHIKSANAATIEIIEKSMMNYDI